MLQPGLPFLISMRLGMIVSLMQYYKALKGQSFNEVTCMITHDQLHAHAQGITLWGHYSAIFQQNIFLQTV